LVQADRGAVAGLTQVISGRALGERGYPAGLLKLVDEVNKTILFASKHRAGPSRHTAPPQDLGRPFCLIGRKPAPCFDTSVRCHGLAN
jgi:hypothetical protein